MVVNKKQIEIELRSIFDKKTYKRLQSFLKKNAIDLGEDDKDVFFFIFPDKLLKVTKNISKRAAKMTLKLNKIGKGSDFEEIEFAIQPSDVTNAVKMFKHLGFNEVQNSYQKRHNYEYKGVELALKHSKTWGHHLELEIIVNDLSGKKEAKLKILEVAKELDIRIMSNKELAVFTKKIDKGFKDGKYDNNK